MKYQKINNKNNKIIYTGKNSKLEKIRHSLLKEKEKELKDCDKTEQLIESKKQQIKKNQRSVFSELEKYKINDNKNDNDNKNSNDNKNDNDNEIVKTDNQKSLKAKVESFSEKDTLIYKKPLPKMDNNTENSIQIKEPMTTKT